MKSDSSDYKVDHLFLLVGKNPLPNYVVAKSRLLLRPKGKPYLVYTRATKGYAETLRRKLEISNQELISLDQYQADAYEIQSRIRSKAEKLSGRLGLNYTGGTKAMAVNAHLAIKSLERDESPIFSYLDPHSVKLLIEQDDRSPIPQEIPLQLELPDIFDLHTKDFRLKSHRKAPLLPDLVVCMAQFIAEWNDWRKHVLDKTNDNEIPLGSLPEDLINALKSESFVTSSNEISLSKIQEKIGFKSHKETKDWLVGKWLEEFVLLKVSEIANEYGTSFEVSLGKKSQFEFDVAFLRGYQLFAFSCTTSSKLDRCKHKLFEAYLRAKQLGGEEARVALVCCSDKPDVLRNQFQTSIVDPTINVFGIDDLSNLSQAISTWMLELEA